jgi:hypothetical protein
MATNHAAVIEELSIRSVSVEIHTPSISNRASGESAPLEITPGYQRALTRLSKAGYALGILSNVDD